LYEEKPTNTRSYFRLGTHTMFTRNVKRMWDLPIKKCTNLTTYLKSKHVKTPLWWLNQRQHKRDTRGCRAWTRVQQIYLQILERSTIVKKFAQCDTNCLFEEETDLYTLNMDQWFGIMKVLTVRIVGQAWINIYCLERKGM